MIKATAILLATLGGAVLAPATATAAPPSGYHCGHQPRGHAHGWNRHCHRYTTPETEPGLRRQFPVTIVHL